MFGKASLNLHLLEEPTGSIHGTKWFGYHLSSSDLARALVHMIIYGIFGLDLSITVGITSLW